MNKLLFAKLVVFILTGLLFASFSLILYKIAKKNAKSNPQTEQVIARNAKETTFPLKEGETIQSVFPCQDFLCFTILKENKINRIQIIHPLTGATTQTITISSAKTEGK